jgi:hypothetical protein
MCAFQQLQECAFPLITLFEFNLHLLIDRLEPLVVLIQRVELIDELLVVVQGEELLHLLDLHDLLLLRRYLLLHLLHDALVTCEFAGGVVLLLGGLRLVVNNGLVKVLGVI